MADAAEVNLAIQDGAERVVAKYGSFLQDKPELAKSLVDAYNKQLVKDPKTGVVLKAPQSPDEFYAMVLDPIIETVSSNAAQAANEAAAADKAAKEAKAKSSQSDRADIPPRGKSDDAGLDKETKEWLKAMESYEKGQ